mgnify:CR=1 FL=1
MKERGWSDYRLAQNSKLSSSTIANIRSRNTVPSVVTLESICNAFGITLAQFFADKNNPFYSVEEAEEGAYEMFCEEGLCPFDLLKYGMEHNLLPDAQFPFENGKALLQENWDFVARWFLGEFYEGE